MTAPSSYDPVRVIPNQGNWSEPARWGGNRYQPVPRGLDCSQPVPTSPNQSRLLPGLPSPPYWSATDRERKPDAETTAHMCPTAKLAPAKLGMGSRWGGGCHGGSDGCEGEPPQTAMGRGWTNVTPKDKDGSQTPLRRKRLGKSRHLLSGPDRVSTVILSIVCRETRPTPRLTATMGSKLHCFSRGGCPSVAYNHDVRQ